MFTWQKLLMQQVAAASAGIVFVGSAGAAGTSSATVTLPAGVQAGDTVVVCSMSTSNPSAPSGYTNRQFLQAYFPGGGTAFGNVYTKVMGSTPDTSVTVTANFVSVSVHVWRGVSSASPINVIETSGTFDPPAVTPTATGAVVLAFAFGGFVSSSTMATPTGYSNMQQQSAYGTHDFTNNYYYIAAVASKYWSGSGAENPSSMFVPSGTGADTSSSITLALRPA